MSHQDNQLAIDKSNSAMQGKFLTDFQRKSLLKSLKADLSQKQRSRIEIMLLADSGVSQSQICKKLRCSQSTARYWITIAREGKAHNWNTPPIGAPQKVTEQYLSRLGELASQSPREYGYAFERWTGNWLSKQLEKELGIKISDRRVNQLLKVIRQDREKAEQVMSRAENSTITIKDLRSDASADCITPLNRFQL
jgi:transposase